MSNVEKILSALKLIPDRTMTSAMHLEISKWLEEQGFPLGSARRVILRALEISSVLEFRKSGIFSQCDAIF